MKTLTLKENQTLYEVVAQQSPVEEPLVLEQGGQRIAVLLPLEEYEAYRAWRQTKSIHIDLSEDRTLEDVVADIKRRGPGVPNYREATASLKDLLENAPYDPDFDLAEWEREWAKIDAEIEADDERDP
jgi:preprotein translocase subunit SecD